MKKISLLIFVLAVVFTCSAQVDSTSASKDKSQTVPAKRKENTVSFKAEVYPLIKKYCMPCHSEDQMNPSELYMDSYESLMEGGKHGSPIEPGKAQESLLIQKLSEKPPFGDRMPLRGKEPLPDEVMSIFIQWINQGATNN